MKREPMHGQVYRLRRVITLSLLLAVLSSCDTSQAGSCPLTIANGQTPPGETPSESYHGNGALWTVLWPEGVVSFEPGGPGEVRADGSLVMKFPWWRGQGVVGFLEIEGRRLDGSAPPLQAEIPEGYGRTGFQASAIVFPSEGCWEIMGRAGEAQITFVALVVREGA
jgi:hypothetical protein